MREFIRASLAKPRPIQLRQCMPKALISCGKNTYLGVILAGGASLRMGTDKALTHLSGLPLWQQVAARLEPQVAQLTLSLSPQQASQYFAPYPCIYDAQPHQGPLHAIAQVLATKDWAAWEWVVFSSCDTPIQPSNWVDVLSRASLHQPGIFYIHCQNQAQYLHSLWHRSLAAPLAGYLAQGHKAVKHFYAQVHAQAVEYSCATDPFINLNTPAELSQLRHE